MVHEESWDDGVLILARESVFFLYLPHPSRTALGPTQPPGHSVTWFSPVGVKRTEDKTVHSPPSSEEVKNKWSYTSTALYVGTMWKKKILHLQLNFF